MNIKTTTNQQNPPLQLRRVKWLAETLAMSLSQTYKAISEGEIPPSCIHKVGRRIRVKEHAVLDWVNGGES